MTASAATFRLESPHAPGGVGLVSIQGDIAALLAAINITQVAVGGVALRHLPGVGSLVLARWSNTQAHLMPHGGLAQLQQLRETLARAGAIEEEDGVETEDRRGPPGHPNHPSHPTDAALDRALARVASPRGVDLLLDQPRRWRENLPNDPDIDRLLNRLIHPPLVAIIGPANVGKSTLVNALCDRAVSIVADQPGTTRDHVGVTVTLDGLTIRLVDCPGFRDLGHSPASASAELERRAVEIATRIASSADLVIAAADPHTMDFDPPAALGDLSGRLLRISLRADLARDQPALASRFDHLVSVHQHTGLEELKLKVRAAIVPDHALRARVAWNFWD
ncbi:MAG: GTP-binding protein [Tepidisphaera sp.]|nr:GTP-binding protein [Tepidisphaera sp.]